MASRLGLGDLGGLFWPASLAVLGSTVGSFAGSIVGRVRVITIATFLALGLCPGVPELRICLHLRTGLLTRWHRASSHSTLTEILGFMRKGVGPRGPDRSEIKS